VAVVDALEVVDVHQQQHAFETQVMAARGGGLVQAAAVGQAGERVAVALCAQVGVVVFEPAVQRAHTAVHQRHQHGGQGQRRGAGQPDLLHGGAVVELAAHEAALAPQLVQPFLLRFAIKTLAQLGQRGVAIGGHHLCREFAFAMKEFQRGGQLTGGGKGVGELAQGRRFVGAGAAATVSSQQFVQGAPRRHGLAQADAGQRGVVLECAFGAPVTQARGQRQRLLHGLECTAGITQGHQRVRKIDQVLGGRALR